MVMGEMAGEADLLVIGGGPGGYAAAFRAARLGLDVILVSDEEQLGGVCLLRGCIPSKALLTQTELIRRVRTAGDRGVRFGDPEVDLDQLRSWKDRVVRRLSGGLGSIADENGVRVVHGRARFESSDEVHVEGGDELERITFDHAVVATGSRPRPLPDVDFGDRVWDSERALGLSEVPDRLLVVGGGYVGLEMGSVYSALGSEVTIVEEEERLLPEADADLARVLSKRVAEEVGEILAGTRVDAIEVQGDEVRVTLGGETNDGTDERPADRVLVAIGREPRSDDLGLENTNVELDDRGFIRVDAERRTDDESIFAVGDVTGGKLLAHEAIREGKVAAEVLAGEASAFDNRAVPAVVYTDPQVAWCGLTERDAEEEGVEVEVRRFPWKASGRALTLDGEEGLTKILFHPSTGRVLGVGIVGRDAEALIAEAALAVEMGAVARDLAETVHPHPTLSETLGEAADLLLGGSIHLASG